MRKIVNFMAGLLLGLSLGAGLIFLFAPQSGYETQQMIKDRLQEILLEARSAKERTQADLVARLEELRNR